MIFRHRSMRRPAAAAAAVFALASIPGALAITQPSGTAHADVCASASGQRVTASGCVDIAAGIDYYAPPPGYYAPLPQDFDAFPNVTTCISATGRRGHVTATGCN
jgi:hypothetical protein